MSIAEPLQLDLTGEHAGNVAAATVPHRHPDHDTSVAAAEAVSRTATAARWDVLALLSDYPSGLTDKEIEYKLGWDRPSGSNRRGDLVNLGQVEVTDRTRVVMKPSGGHHKAAKVWRITEAGRSALRERRS